MTDIGRRIVRHIREEIERRGVSAPAPVALPETEGQPLAAWETEIADSLRVDVDLTKNIPCDWAPHDGCERPARWRGHVPCCDWKTVQCSHHRQIEDEGVKSGNVQCTKCKTPNPPITWTEL